MRSARAHLPKPRKIIRGVVTAMSVTLLEERVVVRVRRHADAEEPQLAVAVVLERVPRAAGDERRFAGPNVPPLAVDLELAGALQDDVDLLGRTVIVALRRLTRLERRLRKALKVRVVQLTDRRAVLRREGLRPIRRPHVHGPIIAVCSCLDRTSPGVRHDSETPAAGPQTCLLRLCPGVR